MQALPQSFYQNETIKVARELLGSVIETNFNDQKTSGMIVETEAYLSSDDPACHSSKGITKRNAAMFSKGGISYVYLIYGVHYCFNTVTESEGSGCGVLIRAIEPIEGIAIMQQRRKTKLLAGLTSGPGNVCKALGINIMHNALPLHGASQITIYQGQKLPPSETGISNRIGINQGTELLYRYYIKNNKWVSRHPSPRSSKYSNQ